MAISSRDEVREGLSSVTRGTLLLLVAALAYVGISFVSRVIVIDSISTAQFSAYALAFTLAGVISAVATLGLPNAIARSLPYTTSDDNRRAMVRGTLLIGAISGLAGTAALFLLAGPLGNLLASPSLAASVITVALQFFSVAIATSVLATLIAAVFQGYEDVLPNALFVQVVTPLLFVAFLGVVLALPTHAVSYLQALAAYAAANVVGLSLLVAYGVRHLPSKLPPGPSAPGALKALLIFAAPLFVVSIMSTLTGSGDTLVLGLYDSAEVAVYTGSLTLARLVLVGVNAAAYIFLPVSTKFVRRSDTPSIRLTYTTITKWMIAFSLPLFLLFFFAPTESLHFVYRPGSYGAVTLPLMILVLGSFLVTLLGPGSSVLVATGRTRLLAYNAIAAGLTDVAVSFALVPSHGYVGAAIAWATANVVYAALAILEIASLDGVHPFRRHFVLPIVLTAIPVALALAVYPAVLPWWSLPPIAVAIALLFVGVILATHSVDEGDALLLDVVEQMLGRPLPTVRRIGRLGYRPPPGGSGGSA